MENKIRYSLGKFCRRIGLGFDASKNEKIIAMKKAVSKLDNHAIVFEFSFNKDGEWTAEAIDFPGLMTCGLFSDNNIEETIIDAIFTYFDVSPEYCDETLFIPQKTTNKKEKKTYTNICYRYPIPEVV